MLKNKYNEKIKIIIITGAYENEKIENKITETLNEFQYKWWDDVFLVPSFLKDKTEPLFYENENPVFDDYDWYRVKAKYCSENNINFHIDNNSEYLMFFNTPFILYNGNKDFKIENKSIYDFFNEEIKKNNKK
jgi:hypothetical protein